jgi:hypothetical protein
MNKTESLDQLIDGLEATIGAGPELNDRSARSGIRCESAELCSQWTCLCHND